MNRLRRALRRAVLLPGWLTALIALPSFALVFYVLASGREKGPVAYVSYAASAYALLVVAVGAPRAVRWLRESACEHPLARRVRSSAWGERALTDPLYRAELSLYGGLAVNLAYAAVKMVSGIACSPGSGGAYAGSGVFPFRSPPGNSAEFQATGPHASKNIVF